MGDQAKITLKGTIKRISATVNVTDKFRKRELWLEETGDHAQTFNLEFHQDSCNTLDNYSPGDTVECQINLRGRYWSKSGKEGVMNTLQCWKITGEGRASIQKPRQATGSPIEDESDLPF